MKKIYSKLFTVREKYLASTQKNKCILDVLSKLLVVAFQNNDSFPDEFYLLKVFIEKEEVEEILKDVGLKATVTCKNDSFIGGYLFKIELIK